MGQEFKVLVTGERSSWGKCFCNELYRSGHYQIRPTAGLIGRSGFTRPSREPIAIEREEVGGTDLLENEAVNQ